MKNFLKTKQSGFTILEVFFYIIIFAVFSIVAIDALITMTRSFKETAVYADLAIGSSMMEKISREIREAYGINAITATSLRLNTTDEQGANKIVEFSLSGSDIQFLENDMLIGNLHSSDIVATDLSFSEITTALGKAVKVSFSIRSASDPQNRVYDFYDTVGLRESY